MHILVSNKEYLMSDLNGKLRFIGIVEIEKKNTLHNRMTYVY